MSKIRLETYFFLKNDQWNVIKQNTSKINFHFSYVRFLSLRRVSTMLDCLNKWCKTWGLIINFDKSKAVHFRAVSWARTKFNSMCGNSSLELVAHYKYLGIVFTEHLDLMQMSKIVAQSTSRTLELLISKNKSLGGMSCECFTKCYDATV